MRTSEEILKSYISLGFVNNLMTTDKKGHLLNPKLHLEVLLDIRDLLEELVKNTKKD